MPQTYRKKCLITSKIKEEYQRKAQQLVDYLDQIKQISSPVKEKLFINKCLELEKS